METENRGQAIVEEIIARNFPNLTKVKMNSKIYKP